MSKAGYFMAVPLPASMESVTVDPVTKGEDGATMQHIEERFNRFENKNTWWRHDQNGTMEQFDNAFDAAVGRIREQLGATHALSINGEDVEPEETFTMVSPADHDLVVGKYAAGTKEHVHEAIAVAKAGFQTWSTTPWQKRVEIIERAADLFTEHFYDLSAVMSFETGKSRFEASIDVDEAIDFLRFYALTMREMNGFEMLMGKPFPNETCHSLRKPWGVFAVFCPFNFPVAITAGMTVAALITGNTVVLKPSNKGCLAGRWVFNLLRDAGVPAGALQFITGHDEVVSQELIQHPDIDGRVFTGSKKIGLMAMQKTLEQGTPKPFIAEMGGKNAVIVSDKADMDKAVQGVYKSGFGFSGQKCSACSRAYVHNDILDEFLDRLSKMAHATNVGKPWVKENFMGPVIEERKVELFKELVEQVKADGGRIVAGGEVVETENGNYVRPTVVAGLRKDHRVFREEFFLPFVAVAGVESFQEGIEEYNKVEYGLTAGCMSEDQNEVRLFFDQIQSGVTYANRAAGGSTAAVVNGQSFVGWKDSGSTGTGAGGRYYLLQFTRERSQTVVD